MMLGGASHAHSSPLPILQNQSGLPVLDPQPLASTFIGWLDLPYQVPQQPAVYLRAGSLYSPQPPQVVLCH